MKVKELTNLRVTHVSYVRKGANKQSFFLMKSDDSEPAYEREFDIFVSKSDDPEKLVYGVVYEPDAVDTQGEFAKAEEIEKAAHRFLTDYRNIDLQHNFKAGFGDVVESYVTPDNISIRGKEVKKGSWVLVTKASDEVWNDIQKGEITGYSMAGGAKRVWVEKEPEDKGDDEFKGFLKSFKKFIMGDKSSESESDVAKAGKAISSANMQKIKEAHAALSGVISLTESQDDEGEVEKMKLEELNELIKEQLKPLAKEIEEMKKQDEGESEDNAGISKSTESLTKEDVAEIVLKAVEPIKSDIQTLKKARGISRQAQEHNENGQVKKSVFDGIAI